MSEKADRLRDEIDELREREVSVGRALDALGKNRADLPAIARALRQRADAAKAENAELRAEVERLAMQTAAAARAAKRMPRGATVQDSRIVPECPRCHARDALMVCCWRCASEGSPEQFNARIVPAPPPAEPA